MPWSGVGGWGVGRGGGREGIKGGVKRWGVRGVSGGVGVWCGGGLKESKNGVVEECS